MKKLIFILLFITLNLFALSNEVKEAFAIGVFHSNGEGENVQHKKITNGDYNGDCFSKIAVLGGKLNDSSSFLICWTQDAMTKKEQRSRNSGGTGHTIDIALSYGVPVLNLNVQEHFEYVKNTLMGK